MKIKEDMRGQGGIGLIVNAGQQDDIVKKGTNNKITVESKTHESEKHA